MVLTHTKKPVSVKAFRFISFDPLDQNQIEAKIVAYPNVLSNTICEKCNGHFDDHGLIHTNSGEATVCPGVYIINNPSFPDDFYPCDADIFDNTYDTFKYKTSSLECCVEESSTSYSYEKQLKDEQKLSASKILLEFNSGNKKAISYLESLISEPEGK